MIEIRRFVDGWRWYGPGERWNLPGFKVRGVGFDSAADAMWSAWARYGRDVPLLVFMGAHP